MQSKNQSLRFLGSLILSILVCTPITCSQLLNSTSNNRPVNYFKSLATQSLEKAEKFVKKEEKIKNYEEALKNLQNAFQMELRQNPNANTNFYIQKFEIIAKAFAYLKRYNLAIKVFQCCLQALPKSSQVPINKQLGIAYTCFNIGNCYEAIRCEEYGLEYYWKSYNTLSQIRKSVDHPINISDTLWLIFKRILKIYTKKGDNNRAGNFCMNYISLEQQNAQLLLRKAHKAIQNKQYKSDYNDINSNIQKIAKQFCDEGDLYQKLGLDLCKKAKDLSKEVFQSNTQKYIFKFATKTLYKESLFWFKKAMKSYEDYYDFLDKQASIQSLSSSESINKTYEQALQYAFECINTTRIEKAASHYHLANILFELEKYDLAKVEYKKAQETYQESESPENNPDFKNVSQALTTCQKIVQECDLLKKQYDLYQAGETWFVDALLENDPNQAIINYNNSMNISKQLIRNSKNKHKFILQKNKKDYDNFISRVKKYQYNTQFNMNNFLENQKKFN